MRKDYIASKQIVRSVWGDVIGTMSRETLARRCGVSVPRLTHILTGRRTLGVNLGARIAKELGLSITETMMRSRKAVDRRRELKDLGVLDGVDTAYWREFSG